MLGLAVVLALLLCRREPRVVAIGARRWLRAVIAAGLALGATLGIAGCGAVGIGAPCSCSGVPNDDPWEAVLAAWTEASAVPDSGEFYSERKERVFAALNKAVASIDAMTASRRLDASDGARLRKRFVDWQAQIAARTSKPVDFECYKPAMVTPAEATIRRVRNRLYALEGLLTADRLGTLAARAAAKSIRCDLDTVERQVSLRELSPKERREVERDRAEVRSRLDALDARLVESR